MKNKLDISPFCLYPSGQGFAFKRKERVRHEYNKLLRKERKKNAESTSLYKEEYPEHLKHLYMAEAEKLKNEAWTNRVNRSKLRMMKRQEKEEETPECDAPAQQTEAADPETKVDSGTEQTDSVSGNPEPTKAADKQRQGIVFGINTKKITKHYSQAYFSHLL